LLDAASLVIIEETDGILTQSVELSDLADEFYCQKADSM
jgi:hypothetical protein